MTVRLKSLSISDEADFVMNDSLCCPNCNAELTQVQTENPSLGLKLLLDQCPVCGGIWFDKYELFQVPETQATALDERKLATPVHINQSPLCPVDGSALSRLRDPYLSKGVVIDKCDRCGGVWLNCGELSGYKNAVARHKSEIAAAAETRSQMPKVKDEYSLVNIAKFLMSPVGFTANTADAADKWRKISPQQLDFIKSLPEEKRAEFFELFASIPTNEDNGRETANLIMSILDIVIRIILRVIVH